MRNEEPAHDRLYKEGKSKMINTKKKDALDNELYDPQTG